MSDKTYYCTLKGLGWAFLLITFFMLGVPLLMNLAIMGPEQYGNYCVRAIHMPCFGLGND